MNLFSNLADLLLILFLLAGLSGTFIPILPGPTLIAAGALLHGLLTDFTPLGWFPLTMLVLAGIIAGLGQTILAAFGTHKYGGTKYGMMGGSIGFVAGFFLPIPGGILIGAFTGAVAAELYFAKQEIIHATKAGLGGVLGLLASFLFEILITFSMATYVIAQFY